MANDDLILERLQRLLCLGLEGQPALDVVEATMRIWIHHLGRIDSRRLDAAFEHIERNAVRWPTPGMIRSALPSYLHSTRPAISPPTQQLALADEERQRSDERVREEIQRCAAAVGIRDLHSSADDRADGDTP